MEEYIVMTPKRSLLNGTEVALRMPDGSTLLEHIETLVNSHAFPEGALEAISGAVENASQQMSALGATIASLTDRLEALEAMLADYPAIKSGLSEFAEALA